MTKDFTLNVYKHLLSCLIQKGYSFQTYHDFINQPKDKVIILRHDVDDRKENSLQFAKIQYDLGIVGTYYFRIVPQSFDKEIIQDISRMGHEIGYHYEDLDFANGDVDRAWELAKKHLLQLREIAEVSTICMHGSPRSQYDNKSIWKKYNYNDLGIVAEPYFDTDFTKVLYLTDTGRRWDGGKVSIRDKVTTKMNIEKFRCETVESEKLFCASKFKKGEAFRALSDQFSFHKTNDIIKAVESGKMPSQVMINFHPQRWTNQSGLWLQELVWQNVKNVVKWALVKFE